MLYRLHDDIGPFPNGKVLPKGSLHDLGTLTTETLQVLLDRGFISVWQSPPVEVLPGFDRKAKALKKVGITNVNELLSMDVEELAEELGISEESLEATVEEAEGLVT